MPVLPNEYVSSNFSSLISLNEYNNNSNSYTPIFCLWYI